MSDALKRRPKDVNQLAKFLTSTATGEAAPIQDDRDPQAVKRGRLGGLKGGAARKNALTQEERKAIAKKAAATRWKKS